jgi:iron complex outermembrane receptor protein
VDGLVVDNIVRPGASAYTSYINLDGTFKATDKLTLKGQIGYTQGEGETYGSPSFEVDGATGISYQPSGAGWAVNPANINPSSPAGLANDWAWNEAFTSKDSEIYGKADAVYDLSDGVLKDVALGFHAAQHTRQVDGWDRGCSLGANGACWTSPGMPFSATNPSPYPSGFSASALGIPGLLIPIAGNPNSVVSILNNIKDGVHGPLSSIIQPQNYYWMGSFKVQEDDYAGYVMAHIGGDHWRGNIGIRLVDTQENAYVNIPGGTAPITTSAFGPYTVDHVQHNYLDPLPSANVTFDLQKNLLLRLSVAESMSRPDYSALGGTVTLTDLTLTGNGGNANLKPVESTNFDGALEWYYAPTSVAAVSVFYDDLSTYVTYGLRTETFLDQFLSKPGSPVFSPYVISSPINIAGHLGGVEMQIQQPLPYNFGLQGNFTYIDGSDAQGNALVGTSKVTYNLVGYYETKYVSARLAYTYRSSYFVGLDRSSQENEAGNGELDASVNFNITPKITFTIDGLNLTNTILKYYAQNPTQVRAVYDNGTQVYAGFHVKF